MQHIKERSAANWPGIEAHIMEISRTCLTFVEHQNLSTKVPVYPWMVSEKL